jgi:hypothetical protein
VRYKTPSILLLTALILSKQQSIVPFPSINSSKLKDETACLQANPAQAGVLHISTRFVLQFQQKKEENIPQLIQRTPSTALGRSIFPCTRRYNTIRGVHQNYKLQIIFN